MKTVLVLGAGQVAKPLLDDLGRRPDVHLDLAALDAERAHALVAGRPRSRAFRLDTADRPALAQAVARADLVVSLLPAPLHPPVAEAAIEAGVPLVTTSYVSAAMRALDARARERGVLLLNECGLDPGIDHMMTSAAIRRLHAEGAVIERFASYSGGLPVPGSDSNPWRYKCSWSPRAVLVSGSSTVAYLEAGEVVEHPNPYLGSGPRSLEVGGLGVLEVYPTRDSLHYREEYGLHQAEDVFRGTLRYPGWRESFHAMIRLGLLEAEEGAAEGCRTYGDLAARKAPGGGTPRGRAAAFLELAEDAPALDRLAFLDLFTDRPLPEGPPSPLDALAVVFGEKLAYGAGERDMVVLEHHFDGRLPGGRRRRLCQRLRTEGDAGDDSAMAITVGTPAAIAAGMVLDGAVHLIGVHIPVAEQLGGPILAGLAERGIAIAESETDLEPQP